MISHSLIPADQNPDKKRLRKEKNKKQKKRWNKRQKDKNKENLKTLVTRFNAKLPKKSLRRPNYSQVTYYSCNKKASILTTI